MEENSRKILQNNKEKEVKLLNPKTDIVFQWLFSNPNITKGLISSLIDEKITDIEIDLNKQILGESITDKTGILDLRAKINNTIECEIEMQMLYSKNFISRILYYWSRLYSKQIKRGNNYNVYIEYIDENNNLKQKSLGKYESKISLCLSVIPASGSFVS